MCLPRNDSAPSTLLYPKSQEGFLPILGVNDYVFLCNSSHAMFLLHLPSLVLRIKKIHPFSCVSALRCVNLKNESRREANIDSVNNLC